MKTILKIILILLVASVVAGAFSIAVNNTSIVSEGGEPPALTGADGQAVQPMERPERGDHEGGSIAQGLSGVLITLAKLTIIIALVLLLEKGYGQLIRVKWILAQ